MMNPTKLFIFETTFELAIISSYLFIIFSHSVCSVTFVSGNFRCKTIPNNRLLFQAILQIALPVEPFVFNYVQFYPFTGQLVTVLLELSLRETSFYRLFPFQNSFFLRFFFIFWLKRFCSLFPHFTIIN